MKFIISFCGFGALLRLAGISCSVLALDLISIALVFPLLKLFSEPELITANSMVHRLFLLSGIDSADRFLTMAALATIFVFCCKFWGKTLLGFLHITTLSRLSYGLATRLFRSLLKSRYALFVDGNPTEMIVVINGHSIHSIICLDAVTRIAGDVLFMVILLGALIAMAPASVAVAACGFILMGAFVSCVLVRKIRKYGELHAKLNLKVYAFGYAVAASIKDVKIMGLEESFSHKFSEIWKLYSSNDARAKTAKAIPLELSELLVFIGVVGTFLYLQWTGQQLEAVAPGLGVLAVSLVRALPTFNRIVSNYNEHRYYRPSLQMVDDLYRKTAAAEHRITTMQMSFRDRLTVDGLCFGYADKMVLDNVSLDIGRRETVAVVGASGSGKSTLLDVLVGLREPAAGRFALDGLAFDPFTCDALRKRVGYVPQDVTLLDESLAFNITFCSDHDELLLEQVLAAARLDELITGLPLGLQTVIGEGGIRLSGGQKQRIGIARALYRQPEMLIFDEATNALDRVTEAGILSAIMAFPGVQSLIMVTHKLENVKSCDRIYLLSAGKIIASGTHESLLATCDEYRDLASNERCLPETAA